LSKASTVQTTGLAHPSFVYIVNCLSPDEAILLKALREKKRLPFVVTVLQEVRATTNLQIRLEPNTWTLIKDLCTGLEEEIKFSFSENLEAYVSNLSGHGILDIRRDVHIADLSQYQKLEDNLRAEAEQLEWYKTKPENVELAFRRGEIEITPFGKLFWKLASRKLRTRLRVLNFMVGHPSLPLSGIA
jgi:Abortive infection alpha